KHTPKVDPFPTTTSHRLLVLDRQDKSVIMFRCDLSRSDIAVESVSWLAETVESSLPPTWQLKHLGTSNGISFPLQSQTKLNAVSLMSSDGVV
ncbi:hypothetical protein HDU98_003471, partial [Podochytrium sp. JEL0797]